ncbi:diguanylate cyclase [Hydrogenimonas cancrithermarum]|uniref:diguanylate cyclase n=1 Tax=Hydrogenimonas cancrithermarum TaxID=2993563 RepID=A0ABN6WWW0_9BACT|nr:diguanylate cyclase [Hydrogenimonas cancrithermarum]BDY13705.1 hypothetical protein HCR_20170 [Hydrogenimonas cancrithermarum]
MQEFQKLPIKVVYVEDDEIIRRKISSHLQKHVDILYTARDGEEGLRLFLENDPDAIVTDFMMPNMNGLEMIKKIKTKKPETPIFVTTAFDDTLYLTDAIKLGITQYISKSSEPDKLVETIRDFFKSMYHTFLTLEFSEEGTILSISDTFAKLLGFHKDELLSRPIERVFNPLHDTDHSLLLKRLSQANGNEHIHAIFRKKDGSEIVMNGSTTSATDPEHGKKFITQWHPIDCIIRSNKQIRERLEKEFYIKSLMKFHAEISQKIISSRSIEEFLQDVVNRLGEIDPEVASFITIQKASWLEPGFFPTGTSIDFERLIPEPIDLAKKGNEFRYLPFFLCAKHNQIVFIDDISHLAQSPLKEILSKESIVTVISIPMKIQSKKQAAGVLSLLFSRYHTFDKEELDLWQSVTDTVTFGMESIQAKLERDALIMKLDRLAHTDKLTGSLNRHRGIEILEHEIARAKRYGHTFSVIFFDIDHFKRINDTYGHTIGDNVLIKAVKAIKNSLRSTDSIIRWGGEEFLIILPETPLSDTIQIARKLREQIESRNGNIPVPITASFGAAEWESALTLDTLISKADSKMYEAKRLGRNRIAY